MTTENAPNASVDPNRLTAQQAAQILSAATQSRIAPEHISADLKAGAPTNPDGTLNLMHYAAWLVRESQTGEGNAHGD